MLFNRKLKSSSPCLLFYCFPDAIAYHEAASLDHDSCSDGHKAIRRCSDGHKVIQLSPYSWLCSTTRGLSLLEIRRKLRSLIARIGRYRRYGPVAVLEFGYDPKSYALNFKGNRDRESNEESPARLPVSPDRLPSAKLPREVVV